MFLWQLSALPQFCWQVWQLFWLPLSQLGYQAAWVAPNAQLQQRLLALLQDDAGVQFAHAIEAQQPATSSGGFLGEVRLEDVLEAAAA